MRLTLNTRGGIAAAIRQPPRVLDSSGLDATLASRLDHLLDIAKAAATGEAQPSRRIPDAMHFTITVEKDSGATQVIQASDDNMPQGFANLLDFVMEHTPQKRAL